MASYHIALDVHAAFSEIVVMTERGKLVSRDRCATSIPALRQRIERVRRPRKLTFEEGPMAAWLSRELEEHVDELLVCEPRRNHWIARDGDKDDAIDARKLAELFRGGFLKAVHQPATLERALLKQQVGLYHDRVRERVRQGNQLTALCRRQGIFVKASTLLDDDNWRVIKSQWPQSASSVMLLRGLDRVREGYQFLVTQEQELRADLILMARQEEPVCRFQELPGVGWIRAITFYVFIDTPWRFRSKEALARYCGIGLERRHSGSGPTKVRLGKQANRQLKGVLMGAAKSTLRQSDSPFAAKYRTWIEEGLSIPHARRNVARAIGTTLWSLWKHGGRFDPERVLRNS